VNSSVAEVQTAPRTDELEVDVVVVGAGLSGLTCARHLEQAGISTVVLEARNRVGGRTLNGELPDGRPIELGGQWIGPEQVNVRTLAEELDIGVFPTHLEGDNLIAFNERVSRYRGDVPRRASLGLLDYLQAGKRLERMSRDVILDDPARHPAARRWDTTTAEAWISRKMRTRNGRNLMRTVVEAILGVDATDISLLHLVFYIASAGNSLDALVATRGGAQQDRLVGGSQELSLRMAQQLGNRVHLDSAVESIEYDDDGALVRTARMQVRCRYVVVAVPPVLTTHIDYTPSLPAHRLQLAQRMVPGSVTKCIAVYEEPFWRANGLTGHATRFDRGPIKLVFDNSPPDGTPGVLLAFLLARDARRLASLRPAERRDIVLRGMADFFGDQTLGPAAFLEHSWAADPWARGCYAGYFTPGGWTDYGTTLRTPVGLIHWAGRETATHSHGSMDGAVSAAQHAARERRGRLASRLSTTVEAAQT